MRKFYPLRIWILTIFLLPVVKLSAQNIAINNSGNNAYVSAILDLSNQNTAGTVGFLPPYVDLNLPLTNFQLSGTAAQSNGILIYATGAGTAPAGLYYWDNAGSTWVAMGGGSTGSGTLNYLARWTPNGSTLGIGVTQDNGSVAVIQQTAAAFGTTTELTVNANATETNAIFGATTIANGVGVTGSNSQTTGTSIGSEGYIGIFSAPLSPAGVFGNATTNASYGVEGINTSNSPAGGAGVLGYDPGSLGTGIIGTNQSLALPGHYLPPNGVGGNFFGNYLGAVGTYGTSSPGGTGLLGLGYGSTDVNANGTHDFAVLGDFGGSVGGAGFGAAVGGFIGNTVVPSYRAGVMGGSNSADYGVLGYNTLATGYALAGINNTGITGNGLFVSGVTYLNGFTGVENAAPTTLFQVGNAATVSGKASVFSQDHVFGQFQIGNPTSDGEASMEFISGATAFGFPPNSVNGIDHLWNMGAGCYNLGGAKFTIADDNMGVIMTLTSLGLVGIGATSPNQELELGGTTNTARIDGLKTGATYNNILATKSDMVYADDANGDLHALPAPSVVSTLVSSATGVLSWQNGAVPTGSGTPNYYARWTPSGTQLGIGFTEDNGTSVSMSNPASAPVNNTMLTVTGNATSVNAIVGTTAFSTGSGVFGIGSGTNSAGVTGSAGSAGIGEVGVYANNTATGAGIEYALVALKNGNTGTGTGYAVYGIASGTATTNYAGYFSATGGTTNYGIIVPPAGGNVGIGNAAPVGLLEVGNGGATGKVIINSQDGVNSQLQIGNPNNNSEASILFISGATAFGGAATSANGYGNIWVAGADSYGIGGNKFTIADEGYGGPVMTLTSAGFMGIGVATTSPFRELEVGGTTNTARIDGIMGGGTFNNALATKSDLVYTDDANGDIHALPAPAAVSTLVSSATGVLSWQNGAVPTGSGTLDYLARWTPNGTTLGIGATEDNGTSVSMNAAAIPPVATQMLTVTGNATSTIAIAGTTAQAAGYGVWGNNTAAAGTPIGVYGTANIASGGIGVEGQTAQANGIGVQGYATGNTSNNTAVLGWNASTGAAPQYGVMGKTTGVGSGGNNYAVYGASTTTGAGTTNYGGYFTASGASIGNYGVVVPSGGGFSGFGINTPAAPVEVSFTGDVPYLQLNTTSAAIKRTRINFSQNQAVGMEIGTDYLVNNSNDFYIYNRALSSVAADFNPNNYVFLTARNNANDFYMTNNGFVGMGTNIAGWPLDVQNNQTIGIRYKKIGGGQDARINITDNSGLQTAGWSLGVGWATGGDFSLIQEGLFGNVIYASHVNQRVGIYTSAPTDMFDVNGTAGKPGGGTWIAFSDRRMKQQINPYTDGLTQLLKISPVTYHYNALSGYDTKPQYVGVIAQELKPIAPYMVGTFTKDSVQYYNVDNSAMTYMIINAVKEQQTMILGAQAANTSQQAEIDELKKQNEDLKQQLSDLTNKVNQLLSK